MNIPDEPNPGRVPDERLDYDENLTYTYQSERFTGIGYSAEPGHLRSEIAYVDGLQEGPARDWFSSGQLAYEANFHLNGRHGATREYREDGSLVLDELYEHGFLILSVKYDRHGKVLEEYQISESGPDFERLQRVREQMRSRERDPDNDIL